jgi:5'-3' exonuclease
VVSRRVAARTDRDGATTARGRSCKAERVQVHLLDGTYELFRHYFGRSAHGGPGSDRDGAVRGVLASVLALLDGDATHLGVATDHVIESFRNALWPSYKDASGVPEDLAVQFDLLEEALAALGVVVWPMIELEADDALASGAALAGADPAVERVVICTPDKDLAQSVVGTRIVQLDRRSGTVLDEEGVREKFGVLPASIPDWLALVGDSADGFPGLRGWGKRSAALVLAHYGHLEAIPDRAADWDVAVRSSVRAAPQLATTLAENRDAALLFKDLATLRVVPTLLHDVDELEWHGPTPAFQRFCDEIGAPALATRANGLRR